MTTDRITEHEDWKDGINAFRQKTLEEIERIDEKLDNLEKRILVNENGHILHDRVPQSSRALRYG